jgi:hypothetical protein
MDFKCRKPESQKRVCYAVLMQMPELQENAGQYNGPATSFIIGKADC